MAELMNYKLTPNAFNSAEGCNNKLNNIIKTLQQQGCASFPPILNSFYLGIIQDKTYENIKDQACTDAASTLQNVWWSILSKYLSV